MIGDDAGRFFHDRHPVRIGHFRDKDGVFFELIDFIGTSDFTDRGGCNGFTDAKTGDQSFTFFFQPIGL